MKTPKLMIACLCLLTLGACASGNHLGPGETYGTRIGSILADEAGLDLSRPNMSTSNTQFEKALFFSDDEVTVRWYAGANIRFRGIGIVQDREDRTCRRFRHGHMIDNAWQNGTAIACREYNEPWFLVRNQWDTAYSQRRTPGQTERSRINRGQWQNLGTQRRTDASRYSFDDFGPRKPGGW